VSSHWTSSTATSTGSDRLRARSALSNATATARGVGRAVLRLRQEQRDLQRVPLGRGQLGKHVGGGIAEQVADRCEGQSRLGGRRRSGQRTKRALARHLDAGLPQRRLPHPRLAGDY
jgi:hypothetical protein